MAEDNVGYKVVAATVVALFLSFAAVIMRFIARRYQGMRTYWEDWFIYAGLVCKLGIDVGGIMRELKRVNCFKASRLIIHSAEQWTRKTPRHIDA